MSIFFTLAYQAPRNAQTEAQQIAQVAAVPIVDGGELTLLGLEIVAGSDGTVPVAPLPAVKIQRSLQLTPTTQSAFLTDFPTLALQQAVLAGLYQNRLCLQSGGMPFTSLPVTSP